MVGTSHPSRCLRGSQSANRRHSQCTLARLRQFCKVPVYLLPWRCPQKHHAPYILIIHSLSFFFCFFSVDVHFDEKKKEKKELSSVNLFSRCNRQPSERLSPKRGPAGTGFQYGAKRHALAGTHSRHSALGQSHQETGREMAFVSFGLVSFFHLLPFGCVCRSSRSRCASSYEEPDGRTGRNICGHEQHLVNQTYLGEAGFVIGNKILMFGKILKNNNTFFSVLNTLPLISFNELADADLDETKLTTYRTSFHSGT